MQVLITGGAGFLGTRLAKALLARGTLTGPDGGQQPISRLTLLDVATPAAIDDPRVRVVTGDISDAAVIADALTPGTTSVFHLAAVVSGQAEADFELGMRINFDATRLILDRARTLGSRPRVVFTSSVAVFGGPLPAQVTDGTVATPQSSYGAQKLMGEILVTDYSRKGYIDGRTLRMPTICVRPGVPNKAASSFASGIIREPLNDQPAVCPVAPETPMWVMSPRKAIEGLIHGHEIDGAALGATRTLNMPGLATSVRDMVGALETVAGASVAARIRWEPDPAVIRIVNSWPGSFDAVRATALGFAADPDFESIVRAHIQDEQKR
ncbi:putative epimerase/dehydratase [Azoarcus sp. Aa7]|nr:putative epimerase/dehydratase [Azoarcus sp. Aa7]